MDVPQFVQLTDTDKHLTDVKPGMLLLQHARVVEECPKIASRHVFHRKVDVFGILERVQQTD